MEAPQTLPGRFSVFGGVWHVSFSPGGRRLATASSAGTVRLWRNRTAEVVQLLQSESGRNLSRQEWRLYRGADIPYEQIIPGLPEG